VCGQLEVTVYWNDRRRSVGMHRKALYGVGKRPDDQRRSSAVLKGAMNLTRCLEIETGGWRRLFP
jgi:hypothetical protein